MCLVCPSGSRMVADDHTARGKEEGEVCLLPCPHRELYILLWNNLIYDDSLHSLNKWDFQKLHTFGFLPATGVSQITATLHFSDNLHVTGISHMLQVFTGISHFRVVYQSTWNILRIVFCPELQVSSAR